MAHLKGMERRNGERAENVQLEIRKLASIINYNVVLPMAFTSTRSTYKHISCQEVRISSK
jgi:hypothetical protein